MPITSKLGWRTEFPWGRYTAWAEATPSVELIERRPFPPRPFLARALSQALRSGTGADNFRSLEQLWRGSRNSFGTQRWDDHRFYHHSLVNQSLHFVSACTFMTAYVLLHDPAIASLLAWGRGDDEPPGRPFLLRAQGL